MTDPTEISVRDLRQRLAGTLNDIAVRGHVVYITNHGHRIAALVPVPMAEALHLAQGGPVKPGGQWPGYGPEGGSRPRHPLDER